MLLRLKISKFLKVVHIFRMSKCYDVITYPYHLSQDSKCTHISLAVRIFRVFFPTDETVHRKGKVENSLRNLTNCVRSHSLYTIFLEIESF